MFATARFRLHCCVVVCALFIAAIGARGDLAAGALQERVPSRMPRATPPVVPPQPGPEGARESKGVRPEEFVRVSEKADSLRLGRGGGTTYNNPPPGREGGNGPILEPVVNDRALDVTMRDTQSTSTLVLGSDSNVIAAYANSRFAETNHYTGTSRSGDGGDTWIDNGMLPDSRHGDAGFPVLARDNKSGHIYLSTHCAWGSCAPFFMSVDDGASWSAPVNAAPGFAGGDVINKPWITVDNFAGEGQKNIYMAFRNHAGSGSGHQPDGIYLTRSTNGGSTFEPLGGTLVSSVGANPFVVVGAKHEVYVFWYQAYYPDKLIFMRKSTDFGETFGDFVFVKKLYVPDLTGDLGLGGGFVTSVSPQVVVNPATGSLYMVLNQAIGPTDKGSIWFLQSDDGGDTWTTGEILNDDFSPRDQFMPTIAVTPDGTRLFAAWYDRRADPQNMLIERYGVIGTVVGTTVKWQDTNFRVSGGSFPVVVGQDPVVMPKYMGSYDHAVADNNFFYTTWSDNRLSSATHAVQPDVRFARIPVGGPGAIIALGTVSRSTLDTTSCNEFSVTLRNVGTLPAHTVMATLATSTPGVIIEQAFGTYGIIDPGSTNGTQPYKVSFAAGFVCGVNVDFTLQVTTANAGNYTVDFTLGTTTSLAAPNRFDTNVSQPLPDLAATEIPIDVSGVAGSIGKVTVSLHATHTYTGDLRISLVGPDNTTVLLSNNHGGSEDDFGSGCTPDSSRTIFDDGASLGIAGGIAPFTGGHHPDQSLTAFIGKTGSAVNGTWKLRFEDVNGGNAGAFVCGSLVISPSTCSPGGTCNPMTDLRRASDFDADGRADLTVFRPSTGEWLTTESSSTYTTSTTKSWGQNGDIVASGDYDGDDIADLGVWRPSTGAWRYVRSSDGTADVKPWGANGDVPAPGDYDGDNRTDLAVFRPTTGEWYILYSAANYTTFTAIAWGANGDVASPGDYDGDGKTDIAVFRPFSGVWYILYAANSFTTYASVSWGIDGDVAVPGDYDGDGKTDIAVYEPATGFWYFLYASSGFTTSSDLHWGGMIGDVPVPGDYDGDKKTDPAFFVPATGTWMILHSSTAYGTSFAVQWGTNGDVPVLKRP